MLELKNIFTRYGKVECLKCVDLTVREGEIVALLGANGAGKSTTLKTISGLVRPTAGEILFRGKKIHTFTTEAVMRLGISQVPEGRKIFHRLTVLENLEIGAFIRGGDRAVSGDIERMFATFPILRTRAGQKAGTLSGGEQQMLAIARALTSRAVPERTTRPVSMTYARDAMPSAIRAFCSTSRIVLPCRLMS
jgi:branched-chain amino acid transport system ATP-binding protein